jgi:Uma2 family endonuclease
MAEVAYPTTLLTVDEFLTYPARGERWELVAGVLRVMAPAGGAHGAVSGAVFAALVTFVEARRLGMCFPDGTGFVLPGLPSTVRSPDVAFVRAERLPPGGIEQGFLALAPDLVVEVLSPSETASDLEEKLRDYRAAGTRLVWVIDPEKRLVSVRAAEAPERWLGEGESLDGGAVLPGFSLPVATLFERLARRPGRAREG